MSAGDRTAGRRVRDWDGDTLLAPGDYARHPADPATWFACTPDDQLANLRNHRVIEHDDGTITVAPSILVTRRGQPGDVQWHGYLIAGTWREV